MHNVLLRNAKHFMVLWKDNKTITEIHFSSIQCVVDKFVTPADIGRIPYKISSGFSALAADKLKNLTIDMQKDLGLVLYSTPTGNGIDAITRVMSHWESTQLDTQLLAYSQGLV